MAIVKEFMCENGCRVLIADDCYRDITPEELARRQARVREVVRRVSINAQIAEMEAAEKARKEARS